MYSKIEALHHRCSASENEAEQDYVQRTLGRRLVVLREWYQGLVDAANQGKNPQKKETTTSAAQAHYLLSGKFHHQACYLRLTDSMPRDPEGFFGVTTPLTARTASGSSCS